MTRIVRPASSIWNKKIPKKSFIQLLHPSTKSPFSSTRTGWRFPSSSNETAGMTNLITPHKATHKYSNSSSEKKNFTLPMFTNLKRQRKKKKNLFIVKNGGSKPLKRILIIRRQVPLTIDYLPLRRDRRSMPAIREDLGSRSG